MIKICPVSHLAPVPTNIKVWFGAINGFLSVLWTKINSKLISLILSNF